MVNRASHGGEDGGYVALSYLFTVDKLTASDLERDYDPEVMTPSGDKVARYCTDEADYVVHYDSEHHETSRDSNFKKEYAVIACANSGGIVFGPYAEDGSYAPWCPVAVQQSKTAYMYFGGNLQIIIQEMFIVFIPIILTVHIFTMRKLQFPVRIKTE